MLKIVLQALAWLLLLLAACEPLEHEAVTSVEPEEKPSPHPATPDQQGEHSPNATPDSTGTVALARTNDLRSDGCTCGDTPMPEVPAVTWNAVLYEAALAHAKDMDEHDYFSHTGINGDNLYQRLTDAGYISKETLVITYGENIAFGAFDPATVVQRWSESPSHCMNMMRDAYREMAVAHSGHYWVQVFGARQE